MPLVDCTNEIVRAAEFGVAHHGVGFVYTEGPNRLNWLSQHSYTLPWTGDCSSFVDWAYVMGGAPAPAKGSVIYTGTLIAGGTPIPASELVAADVVIYFADASLTGSGVHAALVVNDADKGEVNGADPMTISMGHPGAPEYVRVSQDGRPHKFYRYDRNKFVPVPPPLVPMRPLPVTFTSKVPNAILRRGMIGWQVRWLQLALGQTTHFPYWFGKTTQANLGHFQRTNGLLVTGITNAETWKALGA